MPSILFSSHEMSPGLWFPLQSGWGMLKVISVVGWPFICEFCQRMGLEKALIVFVTAFDWVKVL